MFMFPSDSILSSYISHDFLDIYFMFPLRALCFMSSLSRTLQFPLNPILLSSLRLLSSHTRLPLQHIRSLVYILCVLVTVDLRANITCLTSYLSEVPWNAWKLWLGSGRCHAPEWTPPFRHPGTSQERRKDTKDRRR